MIWTQLSNSLRQFVTSNHLVIRYIIISINRDINRYGVILSNFKCFIMKSSIVVSMNIIDVKATEEKPAYTLIAVQMADGASILRTPSQFEADLRGSGFELIDANGETRYRKGFAQVSYPEITGLAVSGDWVAHKAGDSYTSSDGKKGKYAKAGYHLASGFLSFSKPIE